MKRVLFSAGFASVLLSVGAGAVLQPGAYEVVEGYLDRIVSLDIAVTEKEEFVATFVWWDDLPGPHGLERHVAELRGSIVSPKPGIVRFASEQPLRFPLDQEFSVVSDSEIRMPHGYMTKGPDGWVLKPEDTSHLVIRKRVEQDARPNAAEPPPQSGTPPQA